MAGGGGTRLWPLSRVARPKPFLPLLDGGRSLLEATVERLLPLVDLADVFVVTDARYEPLVRATVPSLPAGNVVAEPMARNTAAAVALAAHAIDRPGDEVMIVLPADQVMRDDDGLREALAAAASRAEDGDLVTLGVEPTYPPPATATSSPPANRHVDGAADVPGRALRGEADRGPRPGAPRQRHRLLERGHVRVAPRRAHRRARPARARHRRSDRRAPARCADGRAADGTPWPAERIGSAYERVRATSIDYALLEPASAEGLVAVVPMAVGWDDLGSWSALKTLRDAPADGNVLDAPDGAVIDVGSRDVFVHATGGRVVALVGVSDLVVVDTPDALLVCAPDAAQDVKAIVDRLRAEGRTELPVTAAGHAAARPLAHAGALGPHPSACGGPSRPPRSEPRSAASPARRRVAGRAGRAPRSPRRASRRSPRAGRPARTGRNVGSHQARARRARGSAGRSEATIGRPAEIHVARAPDADISRNGHSATSVAARTASRLGVGDVTHETHPVGDADLPRVLAQRVGDVVATLDDRADEQARHVVRQPRERVEDEPMAAPLRHVAEERDDAPVGEVEAPRARLSRSGSAGRSSTKWGTTSTRSAGTRPSRRRRSSSEWTTRRAAAMPEPAQAERAGLEPALAQAVAREDVVERHDHRRVQRQAHDLGARQAAGPRTPVGELPLDVDDVVPRRRRAARRNAPIGASRSPASLSLTARSGSCARGLGEDPPVAADAAALPADVEVADPQPASSDLSGPSTSRSRAGVRPVAGALRRSRARRAGRPRRGGAAPAGTGRAPRRPAPTRER